MSKFIIWVSGRLIVDGYRKREFKWSEHYKLFIYEGREFAETEFQAAFDKAWKTNADLMPRVRIVEMSPPPVPPALPVSAPPPVVSYREPTADEAEEVLQRLRPDRLKLKPGRKPFATD